MWLRRYLELKTVSGVVPIFQCKVLLKTFNLLDRNLSGSPQVLKIYKIPFNGLVLPILLKVNSVVSVQRFYEVVCTAENKSVHNTLWSNCRVFRAIKLKVVIEITNEHNIAMLTQSCPSGGVTPSLHWVDSRTSWKLTL